MRKRPGWIWWLVAVVGLIALLARRAVGAGAAAPKVAAGYPSSYGLSPHFPWSELWGPAESLAIKKRWDSPGVPSYDARVMAVVAAWLEEIRAGCGGFPIIANTVGYDQKMIGPAKVMIVLYPPADSPVTQNKLVETAKATIPDSFLYKEPSLSGSIDAIMPLDYMPPSATVTRKSCWIAFDKQALMRAVGPA